MAFGTKQWQISQLDIQDDEDEEEGEFDEELDEARADLTHNVLSTHRATSTAADPGVFSEKGMV